MRENRELMDHAYRLFPMPEAESSFERLRRRRDRRRRNRRVESAVLALILAAMVIGGFLRAFREERRQVPASITPSNISQLHLEWKTSLKGGASGLETEVTKAQFPPLVSDYTGAEVPFTPTLSGGFVFVTTSDGFLYAFSELCTRSCTPVWMADAGSSIPYPPTAADGFVFVGTHDGLLMAYPSGCSSGIECAPAWVGQVGSSVSSAPLVANGLVYEADVTGGRLVAFPVACGSAGARCTPRWTAAIGPKLDVIGPLLGRVHGLVLADGSVYVIGGDERLHAYDADTGRPLWIGSPRGGCRCATRFDTPVVADGLVFAVLRGDLYAFPVGCSTGGGECEPRWSVTDEHGVGFGAPTVAGGFLYVGSSERSGSGGRILAFPTDCPGRGGTCRPTWEQAIGGELFLVPLVVLGDVVYATSTLAKGNPFVEAYSTSCAGGTGGCHVLWRYETRYQPQAPISSGGVTYVATDQGRLAAFDASCDARVRSCDPLWRWRGGADGSLSTPVVANGRVYAGLANGQIGELYAFGLDAVPEAGAPQPLSASSKRSTTAFYLVVLAALGSVVVIRVARRRRIGSG
jgi:outer membrane protein assembly factor BamB